MPIGDDERARLLALSGSTLHRLLGWRPGSRSRFRHDRDNRLPARRGRGRRGVDGVAVADGQARRRRPDRRPAHPRRRPRPARLGRGRRRARRHRRPAGTRHDDGDRRAAPRPPLRRRASPSSPRRSSAATTTPRSPCSAPGGDDVRWIDTRRRRRRRRGDSSRSATPSSTPAGGSPRRPAPATPEPRSTPCGRCASSAPTAAARTASPSGPRTSRAGSPRRSPATATAALVRRPAAARHRERLRACASSTATPASSSTPATAARSPPSSGAAGSSRSARAGSASVDTVHAMTVHKSQGSQFDAVAVILPDADSPILTRELLYTAVTRAQRQLTVVGTEDSIRAAVARPIARRAASASASGMRLNLGLARARSRTIPTAVTRRRTCRILRHHSVATSAWRVADARRSPTAPASHGRLSPTLRSAVDASPDGSVTDRVSRRRTRRVDHASVCTRDRCPAPVHQCDRDR